MLVIPYMDIFIAQLMWEDFVFRITCKKFVYENVLSWSLWCLVWQIFFSFFVVWSSRQSKICIIVIFDQKTFFTAKKKNFQVWQKQAIYGETRQIISKTKIETCLKTLVFDCSHIELHLKKYKLKFEFAERNQN